MHQEVNQILAQLSEVHIQSLVLTSKRDQFNYEFPRKRCIQNKSLSFFSQSDTHCRAVWLMYLAIV